MPSDVPLGILIVDDDADARATLRMLLKADGHRVDEAATAAEALGRTDWSPYSMILLDRMLPDSTAVDLLPQLRKLAPAADVLIVTGLFDVEGAISALRQGAADYMLKPVNPNELRARIARLAEHRRAEAEYRKRSLILQSVLSQVADAAIVVDRLGKVLLFSAAVERLIGPIRTGTPQEEWPAHGRAFRGDMMTRYALDELPLSRALRGEEVIDEELYIRPSGNQPGRWVSANASPLRDGEGIQGAVVIYHDITERKEALAVAVQAERLAAIGEIVSGLAHESRNALQRGRACAEMLALQVADRPRAMDLVARLTRAQDDLARHYDEVRDYADPVRLQLKPSEVAEAWRAAWADLEPLRQGRAAVLEERIDVPDTRCLIDRFRITQLFRNLLENALTACADPVRIAIACDPDELDGRPALRVSVRDNGPGIAPELRQRAFRAFFTTKIKGTGLGLAMCQRIMEAHRGRITLGDDPGPGAEFVLHLPRGNL